MIGNGISNVGSWMQLVAQPWIVLTLGGSAFLVGLDGFMGHLPSFLFLIPGGILADRYSRKLIMILSQIVQLSSAALIAALLVWGKLHVWEIIALSFLVGTAQSFSFPAYQALVTTLIPREHLGNAIALNSMQFNLTRVVGPILAGAAMASVGAAWCFGLNSVSFLALMFVLVGITSPSASAPPSGTSSRRLEIGEGFRQILGNKQVLGALLLVLTSTLFGGPLSTFLPVLVRNVFGGSAAAFSVSVATFGAGALVGALLTAAKSSRLGLWMSAWGSAGIGVSALLMSIAPTLWIADVILFGAGVLMVVLSSAANTYVQSTMGNELRARTASFFLLAIRAGLALGNLLTGWAVGPLGIRSALALNGVLALVAVAGIIRFMGLITFSTKKSLAH